ncbi:MAG: EscN/YscN/HrcN family type III secretion system ATPase [Candidatus Eremiobacteraeota bacterium]|nr:EscN/YscN/HrcN family type III secretion system ATPase [Candidatus Eremiobacteraeota bacterium]
MTMSPIALGACAWGRAIDANGAPLDAAPPLRGRRVSVRLSVPHPSSRSEVSEPFWSGVRAIDGLLTFGRGARIGIFGSPGAGKSVLLETIVEASAVDAVVVGLVGERGREAQRWISRCDRRTTIVCATSDRGAQERVRAAVVAASQANALRERGLDVLFVLDSLARFATALRERAVATGERTGRAGFPPSVFAEMAHLVEVAGALRRGSITLVASVLNDGDDRDPVSEAARSLLDGHITLSLRLAQEGRFPAIDVPASASRTMTAVVNAEHLRAAAAVRSALAALERTSDARELGIEPSDRSVLAAIDAQEALEAFLRQTDERADPLLTQTMLFDLARRLAE